MSWATPSDDITRRAALTVCMERGDGLLQEWARDKAPAVHDALVDGPAAGLPAPAGEAVAAVLVAARDVSPRRLLTLLPSLVDLIDTCPGPGYATQAHTA